MTVDGTSLDADYVRVPFTRADLATMVGPVYADLLTHYAPSDILVLKRFPTGIETFADRLATITDEVERPNVISLNRHATDVLRRTNGGVTLIGDTERLQFVRTFLEGRDWKHPYLASAATKPSFRRDVGRLMSILAWQGGPRAEPEDERLAELVDMTGAFQNWLDEQGYLERARVVEVATESLADDEIRRRVQESFEAILAVEFEEFAPIDRQYLGRLAEGVSLTCIAEANSGIQRPWNESGSVWDRVGVEPELRVETASDVCRPAVIGEYLATGTTNADPGTGTVDVLAATSFEDQLRAVADEIDRLRDANGWTYDDFAVGFSSASAPIDDAIRLLQQASIPTASVTVSGFSDAPVVREAYALANYRTSGDSEELAALNRALPDGVALTERDLDEEGLEATLWQWIERTKLKKRIAAGEPPLEARAQFDHVETVLGLASFLEESTALPATWPAFVAGLEELFAYVAPDVRTAEVDVKEDGVLVDAIRVLKNASWKAVFLVNITEQEYPSTPRLTALFPDRQLRSMPAYPGVTTPTATDVRSTFVTAPEPIDEPYAEYYAQLSRRLLAVGARAAQARLYFGVFDEERGGTGKHVQPSRFLIDLVETFPWIDATDSERIYGQAGIEAFALNRIDRGGRRIRQAHLADEPVRLDDIEADLAAIQRVLAAGGPRADELRRALETRLDIAAGRVRHE